MIPRLYEASEAARENAFKTNGLGGLGDVIECIVTEEKNGEYELEMTYPIDGAHFADIENDKLIMAKPNETDPDQIFRIYKIEKDISGDCIIYAEHISYLLTKTIVLPFEATGASESFTKINENLVWKTDSKYFPTFPFTFETDNDKEGKVVVETPKTIRSILGGDEGSILETCEGEYKFDNFKVYLYKDRGSKTDIVIRYGKNLQKLNCDDDISEVYTGILPYWKGNVKVYVEYEEEGKSYKEDEDGRKYETQEKELYLDPKIFWSDYVDQYAYPLVEAVDFSSELEFDDGVDEDGNKITKDHTEEEIKAKLSECAKKYIDENKGWEPASNFDISFVNLWNSDEYKDYAPLERVRLCDTITVVYPKLGIDVSMKVIKTEYNVLTERYESIELGEAKSNIDHGGVVESNTVRTKNIKNEVDAGLQKAVAVATGAIKTEIGDVASLGKYSSGIYAGSQYNDLFSS